LARGTRCASRAKQCLTRTLPWCPRIAWQFQRLPTSGHVIRHHCVSRSRVPHQGASATGRSAILGKPSTLRSNRAMGFGDQPQANRRLRNYSSNLADPGPVQTFRGDTWPAETCRREIVLTEMWTLAAVRVRQGTAVGSGSNQDISVLNVGTGASKVSHRYPRCQAIAPSAATF